MNIKIVYLAKASSNYKFETFNNQLVDIEVVSSTNRLSVLNSQGMVDVVIFDENLLKNAENINQILSNCQNQVKVYFIINDNSVDSIRWAINQPWIDKVIPNESYENVFSNELMQLISKDTQLIMENKQLQQDNRELEFVISQMMLID